MYYKFTLKSIYLPYELKGICYFISVLEPGLREIPVVSMNVLVPSSFLDNFYLPMTSTSRVSYKK